MSQVYSSIKISEIVEKVFVNEIEALEKVKEQLCSDSSFSQVIDLIQMCTGRIIFTGIGKSGLVARKIVATFRSLGSPAIFLHPTEAYHGDLGIVCEDDLIFIVSYGGESDELKNLLPYLNNKNRNMVSISGNPKSTIAQYCKFNLNINVDKEADPLNLAPTSSTTATMVLGDALAITVAQLKGVRKEEFAANHPAGILGKRLLLKVNDVMESNLNLINVTPNTKLKDALFIITASYMGAINVVDESGKLLGILTDGDIRRYLIKKSFSLDIFVNEIMKENCSTLLTNTLAYDALKLLKDNRVSVMPIVTLENEVIGMISLQALLNAGI